MNIRISAERFIADPRLAVAHDLAHRRRFLQKFPDTDPLDPKLECVLGRMRLARLITDREFEAGDRWRRMYFEWLCSIGAPNPSPAAMEWGRRFAQNPLVSSLGDEGTEMLARNVKDGMRILKALGARVFHCVNSVCVYEDPEELGDFKFTAIAAKRGLSALADFFG